MHTKTRPEKGTTYRLLESLPYPASARPGHLQTADGRGLHGAYERRVPGGFQAALINNGGVLHRYRYPSPAPAQDGDVRHSFANLVLTCSGWWQVPDDAERPVTNYPQAEYPYAQRRTLWEAHQVMRQLLAGRKVAGTVWGHPRQVGVWCAEARPAGILSRALRAWTDGFGEPRVTVALAAEGPAATEAELAHLESTYTAQLGGNDLVEALTAVRTLGRLTGVDLLHRDLVNPWCVGDLVISGHAFGYPPVTTAACITGDHG